MLLVGCDGFELPDPPDMSRLVREYQRPDGDLDSANVEALGAEIQDCIQKSRDGAPIEVMDSLVGSVQKIGGVEPDASGDAPDAADAKKYVEEEADPEAGEQSVSGNKIDIGASLVVHHICGGWDAKKTIDADENGTVELHIALDRSGLLPTIWGEFDHCRVERSGTEVELTGDVRLHFGTTASRVGFKALKKVGYLVHFDGHVKAQRDDRMVETDVDLSFRTLRNGHVQLKLDMPDATNVVLVVDSKALQAGTAEPVVQAGLLTRDAIWACELNLVDAEGSCVDEAGDEMAVQW